MKISTPVFNFAIIENINLKLFHNFIDKWNQKLIKYVYR